MDLQVMINEMSAQWKCERSKTQMTLGKIIDSLAAMPPDTQVANLRCAHSYRGYYSDLAFEREDGMRPAANLLSECKNAMGDRFTGYKGGDFEMESNTPLWIASVGCCGEKLMAIHAGGEIETAQDE